MLPWWFVPNSLPPLLLFLQIGNNNNCLLRQIYMFGVQKFGIFEIVSRMRPQNSEHLRSDWVYSHQIWPNYFFFQKILALSSYGFAWYRLHKWAWITCSFKMHYIYNKVYHSQTSYTTTFYTIFVSFIFSPMCQMLFSKIQSCSNPKKWILKWYLG